MTLKPSVAWAPQIDHDALVKAHAMQLPTIFPIIFYSLVKTLKVCDVTGTCNGILCNNITNYHIYSLTNNEAMRQIRLMLISAHDIQYINSYFTKRP